MAVPNIFGTATSAIPLSQLDTNFATPVTIGNTAVQLGNTVTSFGNVTLTNVTISSGNVTITGANVSGTANVSTLIITGNQTSLGNVSITGNVSANIATFGAGSNTAPAITTTGDTNTGIFFPAADTIAFAEGGVEAARFNSSGQLDLVNNPILTGGTANGVAYLNGSKVLTTGSALTFSGTNEFKVIAATGTAYNRTESTQYSTFAQHFAASGNTGVEYKTAYRFVDTDVGELMRLNSTGLGIGTSSPVAKLDVTSAYVDPNATAHGTVEFNSNTSFAINKGGSISLGGAYTGTSITQYGSILGAKENGTDGNYAGYLSFQTRPNGDTSKERMRIDSSGNVGIGTTTPDVFAGGQDRIFSVVATGATSAINISGASASRLQLGVGSTRYGLIYQDASNFMQIGTTTALPISFVTNNTERARIDSSGNLLVGTTSAISSGTSIVNLGDSRQALTVKGDTFGSYTLGVWNASTSGDALFAYFGTETSLSVRGAVSYNRAGGLTVYGTTSDYRAKDITGPVTNSGTLIDSVSVYMGKMKGATQERPMFIAHETPAYAHTGEKDAVDKDGNPVYQQMDATALVPVMWAEIQSLRKRLAALESN